MYPLAVPVLGLNIVRGVIFSTKKQVQLIVPITLAAQICSYMFYQFCI